MGAQEEEEAERRHERGESRPVPQVQGDCQLLVCDYCLCVPCEQLQGESMITSLQVRGNVNLPPSLSSFHPLSPSLALLLLPPLSTSPSLKYSPKHEQRAMPGSVALQPSRGTDAHSRSFSPCRFIAVAPDYSAPACSGCSPRTRAFSSP